MDIVCSTDDNYIKYCCVMLTSLLENNKAENITVHVLGDNLEKKHKEVLRDIVETRYRQRILTLPTHTWLWLPIIDCL